MNQEGPVREQIWAAHLTQKNLRGFLTAEGYSWEDVVELEQFGLRRQLHLLHKGKKRLEHNTQELRVKPLAFDRWQRWVQLRKLMRHHLTQVHNRSEYLKADMASAFAQWKAYDRKQQTIFAAIPRKHLEVRVIANCERIDVLADHIGDKEAELGHLEIQREELMDNFIKGQKLALALWVAHRRTAQAKAFSRWMCGVRCIK